MEGSWVPFWRAFRAQVGAKLAQVSTKLDQVGPKLAKSQHNLNKMGSRRSLGPPSWSHLGAQVGPSAVYVGPCCGKKRVKTPSEGMLLADINFLSIFQRNLTSQGPLRTPKIKQNHWRVFKIQGFRLFSISCSGDASWDPFWRVLAAKLEPSWPKLAPSWPKLAPSWPLVTIFRQHKKKHNF